MEFLKQLPAVALLIVSLPAWAGPYDGPSANQVALAEAKTKICSSTDEYIKALQFLRETDQFKFHEDEARGIALKVAGGCEGASERFSQILVLLKTTGFSETKSLEMALQFAKTTPDVQKNFLEIFSKSFLKEFFDYESTKALNIAFELSRDYKGDPARAREDFIELARFCKASDKLGLPMAFCSQYAVEVAKLSQHFETGIVQDFMELYKKLRADRPYGLDMKQALEFTYNILRNGPTAAENFNKAFDFATTDFKLDKLKAIEFALILADRSYVGGPKPPIMQYPSNSSSVTP